MHNSQIVEKLGDAGFHKPQYDVSLNVNKGLVYIRELQTGRQAELPFSTVEYSQSTALSSQVLSSFRD